MTGSNHIPFAVPEIGEEEINEVVDTLKSNWLTSGPKTIRFEQDFSAYLGVKYALAVNSATSGLHLALEAIGIKPDDKVIVPVNTFTATAEVVRYMSADPIFCDIDPDTFNLDPKKLSDILNNHPDRAKVSAVIPVHIAGQACEMETILSLCRARNIKVIEDAAHAFPATHKGRYIGLHGDITVFSFYATKTICTGEGGMVVTQNKDWAERMKVMRLHGIDHLPWDRHTANRKPWNYSVIAPGFKYNLTDLASSLGIHQLRKSERFLARRNEIAGKYNKAFVGTSIKTPFVSRKEDVHSWHLYIVKVKNRDNFIEKMSASGIGTSVHFMPLNLHPYWSEKYHLRPYDFPVAFKNFGEIVSLPIYPSLTDGQVNRIIDAALLASE